MPCGCARTVPLWFYSGSDGCPTHDHTGKRWDSYTFDDIVASDGAEVTVCKSRKEELVCYGCHDPHGNDEYYSHVLKRGERGVWVGGGYYEPEWEFECEHAYQRSWINMRTTDWIDMAYEDEVRWARERGIRTEAGLCASMERPLTIE